MTQVASGVGVVVSDGGATAAEEPGQKLARQITAGIDRLLTDAHARGPALAWQIQLDPHDDAAASELDRLVRRVRAWSDAKQKVQEAAAA
jgi:hypothetical protein